MPLYYYVSVIGLYLLWRLSRLSYMVWKGKPDYTIGDPKDPYLLRWYILPRNHWYNVYLHNFRRSDNDEALHDHPWWFVSLIIKGQYIEELERNGKKQTIYRKPWSIAFRSTKDRHIVELFHGVKIINGQISVNQKPEPCWTIIITGRNVRTWGFWCPQGFVPWNEFVDHTTGLGNKKGKGCGE